MRLAIKLGSENTLAYLTALSMTKKKCFTTLTPAVKYQLMRLPYAPFSYSRRRIIICKKVLRHFIKKMFVLGATTFALAT
jgi:hypothetical protein